MTDEIDWLSRLLQLVPVSGRVEHRCFFGAPWRIDQKPSAPGEIPYHVILAGSAMLYTSAGHEARRLQAGDLLLLPHGAGHSLHDGSGVPSQQIRQRVGPTFTVDENDGGGEKLDMLCGRFLMSPTHANLISSYFPDILVVSTGETSEARENSHVNDQLTRLICLMRDETFVERLGAQAMLTGLSTVLFALALRFASEAPQAPDGLLGLAANPRLAPAIAALFNQPSHPWTLPELAKLCNMSRATFVRQFQQRLGHSAAELLVDIRMTVAGNELRRTSGSMGSIAEAVGYQSEAAFQRTFKLRMGVTPAQYRRNAQASIV